MQNHEPKPNVFDGAVAVDRKVMDQSPAGDLIMGGILIGCAWLAPHLGLDGLESPLIFALFFVASLYVIAALRLTSPSKDFETAFQAVTAVIPELDMVADGRRLQGQDVTRAVITQAALLPPLMARWTIVVQVETNAGDRFEATFRIKTLLQNGAGKITWAKAQYITSTDQRSQKTDRVD